MDKMQLAKIEAAVTRFTNWLDRYGETSYDHQSFYASKLGRGAKALYYRRPLLGTLAVAPMVLSEALFPFARRLFWKRQRVLPACRPLPGNSGGDSLSRLRGLLLGISFSLGNEKRYVYGGHAFDHHGALRLRSICASLCDRQESEVASNLAIDRRARTQLLLG